MKRRARPDSDVGEVIAVLCATRGWNQTEAAHASGIAQSSISEYMMGKKRPHFANLERLVNSMGYHLSAVEATRAFLADLRHGHTFAAPEDRLEAPGLFARLLPYSQPVRLALVREAHEFHAWALVELLSLESWRVARSDANAAVELAELAVAIAEAIPGTSPWLFKLRAFAWGHLANARRVLGELKAAGQAFLTADRFTKAGRTDRTMLLDEARLPAMKGALRREERRLEEALLLFDQALEVDKGPLRATLLVSKAATLEELDDLTGAVALLEEARSLTDPKEDPDLFYAVRHNLTLFLANAGRHVEAAALLPEVRELARRARLPLDCLRLRWVEAKIAAGQGEVTQAIEILIQVRGEFSSRRMHYDMALASLELATLYFQSGRTGEVKTLARNLVPIFQAKDVHREALVALLVFRQAAEKDAANLELVARVRTFLLRVERDPKLTWSAPAR